MEAKNSTTHFLIENFVKYKMKNVAFALCIRKIDEEATLNLHASICILFVKPLPRKVNQNCQKQYNFDSKFKFSDLEILLKHFSLSKFSTHSRCYREAIPIVKG